MNRQHLIAVGRLPLLVLTLLAWFSLSNHCLLGAIFRPAKGAPMLCHGTAPAPNDKNESGENPCCKMLRATVPVATESGLAPAQIFTPLPSWFSAAVAAPREVLPDRILEIDTGPPRTFAELILQRSLLAHAPPFRA